MAAQRILTVVLHMLSLPQIVAALVVPFLKKSSLRVDLNRCVETVDRHKTNVPLVFCDALITAEDHRNRLHPGIDPLGMLRALAVRIRTGDVQGASTIEQQFVRTVTGRRERTLSRKIREQLLALALSRRRSKAAIVSAYLSVAFYGTGRVGLEALKDEFGDKITSVKYEQALKFVVQLKYPRPLKQSAAWRAKIDRRIQALKARHARTANNMLQGIPHLVERPECKR